MAIPELQAYTLPEASDIPANKVNWAFEPYRLRAADRRRVADQQGELGV